MPRFIDCVPNSQGWMDARCGHVTGSRFGDILAGKGAREAYMWELVAERLAGPMRDSGGVAKAWGHDSEPLAKATFCARTGELIQEVGFALHDRIQWLGVSPDGLVVGKDEFVEVKSPFNSGIHARTLALGMPEVHIPQVQGNAWVLHRHPIFISYDAAFPAPHNAHIQRIERDEKFIKHLEVEVKKFLAEVAIATRDIKNSVK